jgi:protein phosphatase
MTELKLVAAGVTDVGRVRDGNEDAYLDETRRLGVAAVADGMGGHRAGEVASATALESLRASIAAGQPLRDAIVDANHAVLERSVSDQELRGMGTTLTAGTIGTDGNLIVGHVGDSRAYLLHDGELTQITNDHSLVEELVRGGELTPEEAESHPRRSIITRALGIDPDVEVDVYPVQLQAGDRILLCSDGLTTMIRSDEIAGILIREPDPKRAAQLLVDAANAAGGEDNVTAVVVDVVEDDSTDTLAPVSDDFEEEKEEDTERGPRRKRRRRGRARAIARVLVWVLPVLAVLALAFGAIGWYARRTYFVGVDKGRVTVFKGRPGGVLGWDPTVDERTGIVLDTLSQLDRDRVNTHATRGSHATVEEYVARLRAQSAARSTTTTTVKKKPKPKTTTTRPRARTATTGAKGP